MPYEKEITHYPVMRRIKGDDGTKTQVSMCNCGHSLPCPDLPAPARHDAEVFEAPPPMG